MANTPYLDMDLPVSTETPGPTFASKLVDALEDNIDPHRHTGSGDGRLIPSAGLDVDADLPFNNFRADDVKAVTFNEQSVDVSQNLSIYMKSDEFYVKDGAGNVVQITDGGQLAIAAAGGGFGGDYGQPGVTATATYNDTTKTFVFSQDAGIRAKMAQGPTLITEDVVTGNGVLIQAPASLSAGYDWIYPDALPSAPSALEINASGEIQFVNPTPDELINIGIEVTVAAGAATFHLRQADGTSDPTANSPCIITFRSNTLTSGALVRRYVTSALSITVPSGTSMGLNAPISGMIGYEYVYLYALDNAGTIILAVSPSYQYADYSFASPVIMSETFLADAGFLRADAAHTNLPIRLLGACAFSLATPGTWDETPDLITVGHHQEQHINPAILLGIDEDISAKHGVTYVMGTTAERTITLPSQVSKGFWTRVNAGANAASFNVVVDALVGTINGSSTYTMSTNHETATFMAFWASWRTVST